MIKLRYCNRCNTGILENDYDPIIREHNDLCDECNEILTKQYIDQHGVSP